MRFKGLDLNLLIALDALLIEKNITKAGERVFLSQSGMSSALARLREYFGDEILVPAGRDLIPTTLADNLRDPVRRILLELEANIVSGSSYDPMTDKRTYRIMVSELTQFLLVPATLKRVSMLAPNVKVELVAVSEDALLMLDNGDVDIVCLPRKPCHPSHPSNLLFEENYVCVVWSECKEFSDGLTEEQYHNGSHISTRFGKKRDSLFDEWYEQVYGAQRRVEVVCSNLMSPLLMVPDTNRIAMVTERLSKTFSSVLPIKLLPPPIDVPNVEIMLQYHRMRESDAGLQWLIGLFEEEAQKLLR